MENKEAMQAVELRVDLGERSYPIWIGSGLLGQLGEASRQAGIPAGSPVLIITDEHVGRRYLNLAEQSLHAAGYRTASLTVPPGEQSKSLAVFEDCIRAALEAGCDRMSTVVALGGGVVGDLAGFVAASYMRGIRFIQVPTTILAHDSSVGGKVAVNHPLAKNIIGAFHQPEFVLYDTATLQSLPDRDVRSGLAEMVKHGLIWDAGFVDWCEANAGKLLAKDEEALAYGLAQGCAVKTAVVSQDERENGLRAILNLGHTIGHALEAVAGYGELMHGEAIAIGMVGSARLAERIGAAADVAARTESLMRQFGLPVSIPAGYSTEAILDAMMHDKKFKEGRTVFVLPTAIGKVEIRRDVPVELVRNIIEELKGETT
ncbi:3-dehydroquinate synthase [Paenibacillus thiaminolyticus]|uniref:3-dehydroquinate synthase n=1 Tax=Paenibacillus thiaminolyticus TaxID=49283 RepID=A0AAP9DRP3_PANTH|nr:3-dehydroquinate synthase [Paenibacillus thiaminolyticus]MCY9537890.1 3-dehydroquinate synthase [Paenibacillus thiaminolyticus]MCY9602646.1 3-dehydroquinate synthase [Paenibacillus thiaminolyticus]MCY9611063.1 3-dehydroquinate synthase [Paenibacillus thiaminolyticus]MCY9616743.1 3-dehydroquinate synthase [Paenibacillus thiaminolyticus]MCY9619443.1 3-dehydroquinate synthase [Paenibacillus thiaminolyticus]